jgi:hypothetical protein
MDDRKVDLFGANGWMIEGIRLDDHISIEYRHR